MKIGIGSTNKVKVNACKNAVNALINVFLPENDFEITFHPMETETSITDMPLSREEIMKGALERALFVYNTFKDTNDRCEYTLGLEGGVYKTNLNHQNGNYAFLQNWVYAFNGEIGFFGSSASLPLPEKISQALYHEQRELAEVMDTISGQKDVRSNEGAFGILTMNLITRSHSFEMAIINAMAPFFNRQYYHV